MRKFHLSALAVVFALASQCPVHAAQCGDLDWKSVTSAELTKRALVADDLVRLRDVGPANNELPDYPLFTLSPDGSRIAFQIRRAHPETNSYCQAMVVMKIDGDTIPIFVDRGGSFLQFTTRMSGKFGLDSGIPMVITPRWAPDGTWIAFMKRAERATQLWRASSDGSGSHALTQPDWNVVDFRVVDATHILVRYQDKSDGGPKIDPHEVLTGFHYDDRFFPMASSMPIFSEPALVQTAMLDLTSGASHSLPEVEAQAYFESEANAQGSLTDHTGLSLTPTAAGVGAMQSISVARSGRDSVVCALSVCGPVEKDPWWNDAHDAIRFFRRTGWDKSTTEIAEWKPRTSQAKLLYSTNDDLVYCQPQRADQLICLRETSALPRHLVSIDLRSCRTSVLADFNPEFAGLTMGPVSRIPLKSSFGIQAFADVVLPVGYQPGHRYPLIVVQYRSRGFLRGGIGDEFPIQAFANHGYAVMSLERPDSVGIVAHPATWPDVDKIGLTDFADRRNVLSVVEQGVQQLIDQGVADPGKIGITGLSDGSSTVQFAELNSHLFSAGIASGCCWEREQDAFLGPKAQPMYRHIGWPPLTDPANAFWSHISLEQNPARAAFPILFDASDDEFRAALESYVALRETGKPADMFVYPDEHHIKWQPAHRLAEYQRSIDWFDFWLLGKLPDDPERRKDALYWASLKDQSLVKGSSASPRAIQ